ncbi:hypothetical protein M9Y10_001306 [Tritrichomonas musculus]|uniref:PPM-type phosphatase domain-containing protein n=1 Tax=Tritrichomonas musculus TaxID=1915356 RepID=A0ABR2L6N5_9EUKA
MGNQISETLGNRLKLLTSDKENIDLSQSSFIRSLPPEVVNALSTYSNLKTLNLKWNQLENLDNFEHSNVGTLHLSQNHFKNLPYQFFSKFPQLTICNLDCNFLSSFSKQLSETITTLNLSLNCIQTIEVSTLNLPQLQTLDLSKNQIHDLPNNFSKSFPNLQNLDLSHNFISFLPDDDTYFPNTLKELNISQNCIEKVSTSITSLPNLSILNLSYNRLTEIPCLNGSLTKVILSNNKISRIEKQELNSLNFILLQNNEITSFPIEIESPNLIGILLNNNKISEINASMLKISYNLSLIDLSFNQIESIPKELFECFPNLLRLFVHFNKITDIPSEIIYCQFLQRFNISFNPIKKLPKLPTFIEEFSASNCLLEEFNISLFSDMPTTSQDKQLILKKVDLSGNKIESFLLLPSIQVLNLSQNRIKKMPILTPSIKNLDLSMNQIESKVESMPIGVSAKSLIDINLAHNNLTEVPQLQGADSLQYITVCGNEIQGSFDVTKYRQLKRLDISGTNIEIIGDNSRLHEVIRSVKNEDDRKTVYLNMSKSGYSEILGVRESMEDSIILRDDLNLYAVLDGHGGPETAKYASIEMSKLFESTQFDFDNQARVFLDIFEKVQKGLKDNELKDGSTLCLALVCTSSSGKRKIVTAHLGDARALIVQNDGKSRELTKDHKPSMRSEFERIHNIHGYLSKENRVDGTLAVSRALGDFDVYGIGREPVLNEFEIKIDDKYLVICCDGVFDVLSNDDVAQIAVNSESTNEAAFKIRNAAFGCGSLDNISVIVVDLAE